MTKESGEIGLRARPNKEFAFWAFQGTDNSYTLLDSRIWIYLRFI